MSEFKKGASVKFKTSRMKKAMRGTVVNHLTSAFGPWLNVKGEDGKLRTVRVKSCKAA